MSRTPVWRLRLSALAVLLLAAPAACGDDGGDLFDSKRGADSGAGDGRADAAQDGAAGTSGRDAGNAGAGGNATGGSGGSAGDSSDGGDAAAGGSSGGSEAGSDAADVGNAGGAAGADSNAGAGGGAGMAGMGGCGQVFHSDVDGDGFGDPDASVVACTAPAGHVKNGDDCYDSNADAKPGQMEWFGEDRGDGSYDYDCDSASTKRFTDIGACSLAICYALKVGWQQSVPECGIERPWITTCVGLALCAPQTEPRKQECR